MSGLDERLLVILMASRLALSVASLGIGLLLEAAGGSVTITEWQGFYGAVSTAAEAPARTNAARPPSATAATITHRSNRKVKPEPIPPVT